MKKRKGFLEEKTLPASVRSRVQLETTVKKKRRRESNQKNLTSCANFLAFLFLPPPPLSNLTPSYLDLKEEKIFARFVITGTHRVFFLFLKKVAKKWKHCKAPFNRVNFNDIPPPRPPSIVPRKYESMCMHVRGGNLIRLSLRNKVFRKKKGVALGMCRKKCVLFYFSSSLPPFLTGGGGMLNSSFRISHHFSRTFSWSINEVFSCPLFDSTVREKKRSFIYKRLKIFLTGSQGLLSLPSVDL